MDEEREVNRPRIPSAEPLAEKVLLALLSAEPDRAMSPESLAKRALAIDDAYAAEIEKRVEEQRKYDEEKRLESEEAQRRYCHGFIVLNKDNKLLVMHRDYGKGNVNNVEMRLPCQLLTEKEYHEADIIRKARIEVLAEKFGLALREKPSMLTRKQKIGGRYVDTWRLYIEERPTGGLPMDAKWIDPADYREFGLKSQDPTMLAAKDWIEVNWIRLFEEKNEPAKKVPPVIEHTIHFKEPAPSGPDSGVVRHYVGLAVWCRGRLLLVKGDDDKWTIPRIHAYQSESGLPTTDEEVEALDASKQDVIEMYKLMCHSSEVSQLCFNQMVRGVQVPNEGSHTAVTWIHQVYVDNANVYTTKEWRWMFPRSIDASMLAKIDRYSAVFALAWSKIHHTKQMYPRPKKKVEA